MAVGTAQLTVAVNGATTAITNQLSSDSTTGGNLNSEVALVDNTQTLIGSTNGLRVQGQGTAGTASGGVLTVQGVASMTPLAENLSQVGGSAIALGQALATASLPVVLTAAQITSLTAPIVAGGGTAGSAATGVVTVQGIAGGTSIPASLAASNLFIGNTQVVANAASAALTRTSVTTAYAVGQLIANSATAGSVTPFSFTAARIATGNFFIRRARLSKSTSSTTNAAFRLHLFVTSPTVSTTGDYGTFASVVANSANYLGYLDVLFMQGFSDGASGQGAPGAGSEISVSLASGSTIYGLLEARGAYTPGNAETFTPTLEVYQN